MAYLLKSQEVAAVAKKVIDRATAENQVFSTLDKFEVETTIDGLGRATVRQKT